MEEMMDQPRKAARFTASADSSGWPSRGLMRFVDVTARTAWGGAQEVGRQLLTLTRVTAQGAQAASLTVASDLRGVAHRAAAGTAQGLEQIGRELVRLRPQRRRAENRPTSRQP